MKRVSLLVTVALMLAAAMALSGVAQAAPTIGTKADAKCLAEAAKTVDQPGFNPSNYTFIGGTDGGDNSAYFTDRATAGPDVFCGFGGVDVIDLLDAGDIFLGGADPDIVHENDGTFYGGEGGDIVTLNFNGATFYGGEGNDRVFENFGTFYGGEGNDTVRFGNPPVDGP